MAPQNKLFFLSFLIVAFFSSSFLHAATSSSDDSVIDLTQYNFDRLVTNSDAPWIVAFIAPWCGHCQRLHPEYEKAAKSLGGVVNMGRVNCDNEKELAQRFGIKGFPTIKVFPTFKSSKQNPEDYQGARESGSLVSTALSLLNGVRDPVRKIETEEELTQFITSSEENDDSTMSKVILFSSKSSNPNLFKSIAVEFTSKKVNFAFVGDDKFLDKFGIDKTPAVLLFKNNNMEDFIKFDGASLKKNSLVQFIETNIEKGELIEDQETFSKKCEKMCVIGFVNAQDDSQVSTLKQVAGKYPENVVVQVNAGSSAFSALKSVFNLEEIGNEGFDLAVFRGHKLKYATKQGVKNVSDASVLLDRVIGGDQTFHTLSEFPQVGEAANTATKDEL
ncbi:hypothetical protein FDP41_006902 [Naegleria fowleri]|uniref:Thioredoxin domain-containing protein n=1 Tax=Naegleria fowleri TaxID=5763 RepID=A0A6A5BHK8_NAEFO|nr:uncharacterized protein FDP41_006902 [Naegleria fowleri]KAF0974292.1 hypothetical protein FDP41_006902 [Naegleria fowleri]